MKTKEELDQLRVEYGTLSSKLKELSEEELKEVTGGCNDIWLYEHSFDAPNGQTNIGSIQKIIGDWTIEEHSK